MKGRVHAFACPAMTDRNDLLELAIKCRLLSVRMEDEAAARSLDRLADDYETQASVVDYLARRFPADGAPHARVRLVSAGRTESSPPR